MLFEVRWRLLRHDLIHVLACHDLVRLAHGAASFTKFCLLQALNQGREALAGRRDRLVERTVEPRRWCHSTT